MKILQVVPVIKSAITTQAEGINKNIPTMEFKMITFHPKRPDNSEIKAAQKLFQWCDILDAQYWKSAVKLKEFIPTDQWQTKKKILSHYNPYNLHEEKWEDFDINVVVNSFQKKELPQAELIPLSIDLNFFKFKKLYTVNPIIHMSVSRIEGKKGVEEVAQACRELKYKFILVGRISDASYMDRVKKAAGDYLDFRQDISNEKLRESYYESAIHVCNSVPNFESGTLCILEAMACGLPVLTQNVGHVNDLYSGSNIKLLETPHHDVNGLKLALKDLMGGRNTRIKMRNEAVETVKERSHEKRAAAYEKLYKKLNNP